MSMARRSGLLALFVAVAASGIARAAPGNGKDCSEPEGDFWSALAPGPDCGSPLGFCTSGELTGDIEGSYHFEMTSMVPVPGDEALGHFTFTGNSTITTVDGSMFGEDHGELWLTGDFAFMTSVGIFDGDECYEGAEGSLTATGNLDLATGRTEGTYDSLVCHAQNCFHRSDRVSEVR